MATAKVEIKPQAKKVSRGDIGFSKLLTFKFCSDLYARGRLHRLQAIALQSCESCSSVVFGFCLVKVGITSHPPLTLVLRNEIANAAATVPTTTAI